MCKQHTLLVCSNNQATGSRLGTLLETTFGLLLALGIAFGYSWLMTFVILGFVPFLALATIARFATIHSHILRSKKAMLEAGKVRLAYYITANTVCSVILFFTALFYMLMY